MGIPSYFSYIVKNHRNIIQKIKKLYKKIDNLYLDSNSIIYDCLREIQDKYTNDNDFEELLMCEVCKKIDTYIKKINPINRVIIAFDGVAPIAKLEQQRSRRFKSMFEIEINKKCSISNSSLKWNKTAITPGTKFMDKLNVYVNKWYYNDKKVIVSGSNKEGEGEHKLFHYIRSNRLTHSKQTTVIYGLDADLIMLCLNHLHVSKNIYLYRETPEFIKSIDSSLDPNSDYILNIPLLSQFIIKEMNSNRNVNHTYCMYDYILLCFFLGNDFLPHFPALNIRTNGIQYLLNAYLNTIGKTNQNLTNGDKIYWGNLKKLIDYLSKNEEEYIKKEYNLRNRMEKREFNSSTPDERQKKYLNIPIKNRDVEKLIDPYSYFWQKRYYKYLFKVDITNEIKKQICINYMEGLEWTLKYYSSGCVDWRWVYNYNYPPLLEDLIRYMPSWDTEMVKPQEPNPISSNIQLVYVLPVQYHYLINRNYTEKIKNLHCFKDKHYEFQWSFCKYFWESHVVLPEIDIEKLVEISNN
tara:strand:- start:2416 stop:3984 length:1569 start_codon:yes stop_codon:yes gene_type:complete